MQQMLGMINLLNALKSRNVINFYVVATTLDFNVAKTSKDSNCTGYLMFTLFLKRN